jgi:hypothetical protein
VVTYLHPLRYEGPASTQSYAEMTYNPHHRTVDFQRKPPAKAKGYQDAQDAIDATLDAWLPRLIETNDRLSAALMGLRDFYLAGPPMPGAETVLAEVEQALKQAAKTRKGV